MKKVWAIISLIPFLIALSGCDLQKNEEHEDISIYWEPYVEGIWKYTNREYSDTIELKDSNDHTGFMDGCGVHFYQYEAETEEVIKDLDGWKDLPMTDKEYNDYIKDCFRWPLEEYDYLADYRLTDVNTHGYWNDASWYRDADGAHEQSNFIYGGTHEIIFILEKDKTIIYAYKD